MSVPKETERHSGTPVEGQGVLSNLPRTRPQRSSPRRAAAREGATRSTTRRARASFATGDPVPMQGFECEDERASGPVQPPGGAELLTSAAEVVGELAKAGLSTGERLFKDVLSRLPIS